MYLRFSFAADTVTWTCGTCGQTGTVRSGTDERPAIEEALAAGIRHDCKPIDLPREEPPMPYVPQHAAEAKAHPLLAYKAYIVAAVGVVYAVIEGARAAFADNVWDANDTMTVTLLGLGALLAYLTPNPIVVKPAPNNPDIQFPPAA